MPVDILNSLAKDNEEQAVAYFTNYIKNASEEEHKILERVSVTYHLQMGFAADEITAFVKKIRADMIVMGTTGASKLKAMFLGSVAGEVMEKAACPVLVIPQDATFDGKIQKIAMPIDFDKENEYALAYMSEFSKKLNAKLTCFHVDLAHKEQFTHEMKKVAQKYEKDYNIFFEVIEGTELLQEIGNYATKNEVDVLAMLTHKRSFFKELFSLNHAKQLSYKSSVPILAIQAHLF